MAVGGWEFQKTCIDSTSVEGTGRCHLSSGEAGADLKTFLQLLDIHSDIHEKFDTTNTTYGTAQCMKSGATVSDDLSYTM